jgi:hypothetical protein
MAWLARCGFLTCVAYQRPLVGALDSKKGKIRSLADGQAYVIDDRALAQTKVELKAGDKVLFAPFEDPDGKDYAKVLRIIELNA